MVAINRTPGNDNYLPILGWEMTLARAPHVEFFVQQATIPEISLPQVDYPNPLVKQPLSGDHMEYGSLATTFIVDENLQGYSELHDWITGLGFPKDTDQYKELADAERDALNPAGLYSDVSLLLLTSLKNYNIEFIFRDAWPTSMSGWEMDVTTEEVMFAKCTVTFIYSHFDIEITT